MLELAVYENSLCACGLPESIADEDPNLELTHRVCPVCAGLAVALRVQADADRQATALLGEKPPPGAKRPDDGRRIGLRPKRPSAADAGGLDGDPLAQ